VAEYCAVNELEGRDCLNFMAYALVKGLGDIESRLGQYDKEKNNWRYGSLTYMRYEHNPFTATPLRRFFDFTTEGVGSKRSVNIAYDAPSLKDRYEASGGSIQRFIADFTDHTSVYLTMDTGVDQSLIWNNPQYNSMHSLYQSGKLFRLPTTEVQEQIRFKLEETAPDIYLYTGEKQALPKKPSGCPFASLV